MEVRVLRGNEKNAKRSTNMNRIDGYMYSEFSLTPHFLAVSVTSLMTLTSAIGRTASCMSTTSDGKQTAEE